MQKLDFPSILTDSSRSLMDYTAAMVGDDQELFRTALDIAYQQKSPLCMRAARVVDLCCERNPELIRPYLVKLVLDLPGLKDMAVKRVFMHILTRHSWVDDDEAMGKLVDTLFNWLMDDSQSVAVKAYSMAILENITGVLPDLKGELALVLEESIPFWSSVALQGGGRRLLKRLKKGNTANDQNT
jgi:hypothetical protein